MNVSLYTRTPKTVNYYNIIMIFLFQTEAMDWSMEVKTSFYLDFIENKLVFAFFFFDKII
jgi:hypothetical protein